MVEIGGVDGVTAVPEKASAILPGARLAPDRLCLQCDTLVTHKAELDQLSKAAVSAGRRAVRMVEEHREAHASEWAVLQSVAPRRNRSAGDRLASRVPWSGFGRSRDTHPRKADVGSGLGTAQFCRPVPVRGWQPCESHPGVIPGYPGLSRLKLLWFLSRIGATLLRHHDRVRFSELAYHERVVGR